MSHDVTELRRHLFETLSALTRKEDPMPVDRARAVSDVAKTIIESARVEVEAAKVYKRANASGFLQLAGPGEIVTPPHEPGTPPMPRNGINSITRHTLGDD